MQGPLARATKPIDDDLNLFHRRLKMMMPSLESFSIPFTISVVHEVQPLHAPLPKIDGLYLL